MRIYRPTYRGRDGQVRENARKAALTIATGLVIALYITARTSFGSAAAELPQDSLGKVVLEARKVEAPKIVNLVGLLDAGASTALRIVRTNSQASATDTQIDALTQQKQRAERSYVRSLLGRVVAVRLKVDNVVPRSSGRLIIVGHLHWRSETTYNEGERHAIATATAVYRCTETQLANDLKAGKEPGKGSRKECVDTRNQTVEGVAREAKAPRPRILIYTDRRRVMLWHVGDYRTVECVIVGATVRITHVGESTRRLRLGDYSGAYFATNIKLFWVRGRVPQAAAPKAHHQAARFVFHLATGGRIDVSSYTKKGSQYTITLSDGDILGEDVSAVTSINKKAAGIPGKGR